MGTGSQLDRALDHRAPASAINGGAGGYGPLAGKKKRALAVDPGLPIRPPNVGGTGRAVASSLLRSGGGRREGRGAPRPRRFQRNYTASLNLNLPFLRLKYEADRPSREALEFKRKRLSDNMLRSGSAVNKT